MHSGVLDAAHDDFHRYDEARRWLKFFPLEYTLVYNLRASVSSPEFLPLLAGQLPANLNDCVSSPLIHVGMFITDIIKYVIRQCAVARADFIYDEIFIGKVFQQVFRDQTSRDGLSVPRLSTRI